jgi:HEPN domain-containing protein
LLRKAANDLAALSASRAAGVYDAACFHAQQAAEKYLKAFLVHVGVAYPPTHNLTKLVDLCFDRDPSFRALDAAVAPLTPYAVELRYDTEFWPTKAVADEAEGAATAVRDFVLARLPDEFAPKGSLPY